MLCPENLSRAWTRLSAQLDTRAPLEPRKPSADLPMFSGILHDRTRKEFHST